MEKYLHCAQPTRKETLTESQMAEQQKCDIRTPPRRSLATTNINVCGHRAVSRLLGSFFLMNTFNQFCFRKRTISCGYPFTNNSHSDFCSSLFRFYSVTDHIPQSSSAVISPRYCEFISPSAWVVVVLHPNPDDFH